VASTRPLSQVPDLQGPIIRHRARALAIRRHGASPDCTTMAVRDAELTFALEVPDFQRDHHSSCLRTAQRVSVDRIAQAMLRGYRVGASHAAARIHPLNLHESLEYQRRRLREQADELVLARTLRNNEGALTVSARRCRVWPPALRGTRAGRARPATEPPTGPISLARRQRRCDRHARFPALVHREIEVEWRPEPRYIRGHPAGLCMDRTPR